MAVHLFPHNILSGNELPTPYVMRPLNNTDYNKGFAPLLSQLTDIAGLDSKKFDTAFAEMVEENKHSPKHIVVVIEDVNSRKIVATGTLLIERKFARNIGLCGHIEDIVVLSDVRGAQLGRRIIQELKDIGTKLGCYKIILDCEDKNVGFYEKLGFQPKERQMAVYLKASKL
eukprot:TRINITY_DN61_c0_g2_i1.p1 TRINITY_DN61_c0_g2~~TRINITY_DN61_c0_g2_i1.p1  ORF type:complete len:184 (-),score=21.37 TRINITY_DN61_c0_g2_i1:66-581(-)